MDETFIKKRATELMGIINSLKADIESHKQILAKDYYLDLDDTPSKEALEKFNSQSEQKKREALAILSKGLHCEAKIKACTNEIKRLRAESKFEHYKEEKQEEDKSKQIRKWLDETKKDKNPFK